MASVHNLFRAPKKHLPMEELREAQILADFGFEGCSHAQPAGNRQVLLIDRETLEAMELQPGILRENITTDGLNVNSLQVGQQLRIGEARLEVTLVCTPCNQMERIRPGLRKELWGRRGMLCRVLESGIVRPRDPIEKLP
jgi:MOSC domain-containing protein YiiM